MTDNPRTFFVTDPEIRTCIYTLIAFTTFDVALVGPPLNLSLPVNGTGGPTPGPYTRAVRRGPESRGSHGASTALRRVVPLPAVGLWR